MRLAPARCRSFPAPICIAGVHVHPLRQQELLQWIIHMINAQQQVTVMYCNAYAINLAQHDNTFRQALNSATVTFCDGYGVKLAADWLGQPVPERFTPPDWIIDLVALCVQQDYRLFLLGGKPGIVARAARRLQQQFPTIEIMTHHGYFEPDGSENAAVIRSINAFEPHILLVGMGMPRQEQWVQTNLPNLAVPVAMTVGALFDYLAEEIPRGPRWLTDHGLEWLCRLVIEPRRLWRRYVLGNPYFVWLVVRQMLSKREPDQG